MVSKKPTRLSFPHLHWRAGFGKNLWERTFHLWEKGFAALYYNNQTVGEGCVFKMLHRTLRDFWSPKMSADIKCYMAFCNICRKARSQHQKLVGLLQIHPRASYSWHIVSLDFITDLSSVSDYTSILVAVDLFTNMAHFIPCNGLVNLFWAMVFTIETWYLDLFLVGVNLLPDFEWHCSNFWMFK